MEASVRCNSRRKPSKRTGVVHEPIHLPGPYVTACSRDFRQRPSSRTTPSLNAHSHTALKSKEALSAGVTCDADSESPFSHLPLELYHELFLLMGPRMVARVLPCVCRKWQAVAADSLLWEALALRYFNELAEQSPTHLAVWEFVLEASARKGRLAFRMCVEMNGWTTRSSPDLDRRLNWSGASKPRRVQRKEAGKGGTLIARRRAGHILALMPSRASIQMLVNTFGVVLQEEELHTGHPSTRSQLEGQGFSVPDPAGYLDVYSSFLHVPLLRGATLEEIKTAIVESASLSEAAAVTLAFSTTLEKVEGLPDALVRWKISANASPVGLPLLAFLDAAASAVSGQGSPTYKNPRLAMTLQKYQGWNSLPERCEIFSRLQHGETIAVGDGSVLDISFDRIVFGKDRHIHEPELEIILGGGA